MPLQVIPWSPSCLFCVSGIHPERNRQRNHGSTRSARPIREPERTAICKSQLESIRENPGNTRGKEQAFGRWFADGLYRGLVSSATQAIDEGCRKKNTVIFEKIKSSIIVQVIVQDYWWTNVLAKF